MNILKKHPTLGVWCTPLKYFSEFYKLFLGFYKSQFSGTTFVLVEKCLLLVYGLFKNLKNLMFIMVRCHKTLNGAIYINILLIAIIITLAYVGLPISACCREIWCLGEVSPYCETVILTMLLTNEGYTVMRAMRK